MKQWPSPAKLNLFLYITAQREDKYHNLQTLFQLIDYCDYLTFEPRDDKQVRLQTEFNGVNHDDNLIVKSAKLLIDSIKSTHADFEIPFGVNISIEKNLPMGGGIGGGSSNAATTLVALNSLWQLGLSCEQLMIIGRKIGADVPVFIFGHNGFAQGVGDELEPVTLPEKWFLVVKPEVEILTASIFNCPTLKRNTPPRELEQLLHTDFTNDCEPTVRSLYPVIDSLIKLLATKAPTRLTGTGSCVFSECETKEQAEQLQQFLNQQLSTPLESFIAKGINRSPLFG